MIRITGEDGTETSLRRRLGELRSKAAYSARAARTNKPGFLAVDKAIDAIVRNSFRDQPGWAPLAEWTEEARFEERDWYSQPPTREDEIGRWTDTMYQGLLGRGARGSKVYKEDRYERRYDMSEVFRGRNVGDRVVEFHEGTSTQPARPLWKDRERSAAAVAAMTTSFRTRIGGQWQ